ncbi:carbamate kinase [Cryobacterium zongtaii]|uniref:Carbamate kinase n=1 Tax=Cryobacterium zongtaii TaxID=1259217 RepID=A0A2S3ZEE1_9MICO|nr:carbamate kinase [Cryobacterium zongtaii]POH64924.1 carbamate kinase [Cryobacterium zongtaii]
MSAGIAVVAFGGNALVRDDTHQSIADQYATVVDTVPAIVDMIEGGWNVVVTHGNGPQVGYILRRSELARDEVAPVPLDYAVGDTQGAIGYMFSKALHNELTRRGIQRPVVSVVTQTVVDSQDPAFTRPTKPVGAFFAEAEARRHERELGWTVAQDGSRGWRRTVPSPQPQEIVELETIRSLATSGTLVIASGGGGIPVTRATDGQLVGVEAVIDKDRSSALLAVQLEADLLVIPTGVDQVAIHFGTPEEQWLSHLSPELAANYAALGHFGEGSMQPKVEAILDFLRERPTAAGLITSPACIAAALKRRSGTWIENDGPRDAEAASHTNKEKQS